MLLLLLFLLKILLLLREEVFEEDAIVDDEEDDWIIIADLIVNMFYKCAITSSEKRKIVSKERERVRLFMKLDQKEKEISCV